MVLYAAKIDREHICCSMVQSKVGKWLQSLSIDPVWKFAVVSELIGRKIKAVLGGATSDELSFDKGCGQAPSETPAMFYHVFDQALAPFVDAWNEEKIGF